MAFNINFNIGFDAPSLALLTKAVAALTDVAADISTIKQGIQKIMSTLDEDITAIQEQTTVVAGLVTFIKGLKDQIAALPALTADQQAKIDQIFASVNTNTQAISDALTANTPAAAA
jgi:uncharacterized protein YegL